MSSPMPNPFVNSAEELTSGTAECEAVASSMPPALDAAADLPAPINVIGHNPITHAVEVRPQVSPGVVDTPRNSGERDLSVMPDPAPGESVDPQDLIDEIFVGARRLQPRELPPDFQARLLAAIESDEIWADEPPLFLQRARDV